LADIFSKACQARASASVCIHYQNRCLTYASRLLAIATGKFIIETPAPVDGQSLEQAATGEGCFVSFRHREHRYFLVARAMGDSVHVDVQAYISYCAADGEMAILGLALVALDVDSSPEQRQARDVIAAKVTELSHGQ
jgi:hypothetical protein